VSERIYGVVIGVVKDLDDPLGEGRVRVQFPWLSDQELSGWAPVARPMAGKSRGQWFMPELDDEALVAFEHGMFDHPFIVGFLHNGVDLPPDDGIDKQVRRLRTVSGHVLEFDDRSGKERITLKTHDGHFLEMKDDAGTIEIRTKNGQQIILKDTPAQIKLDTQSGSSITIDDVPGTITAQTPSGVSLEVSDAGGVTVTSSSMPVKVNCLAASVTASSALDITATAFTLNGAAMTFNGAIAVFSGVIQCQTLITQAVVSPTYTPGAGNLI
jgi:phage baseplate assembly protein gpV